MLNSLIYQNKIVFAYTCIKISLAHFHLSLQRVIELSKQYLPQTGVGFSSPKVHVHIRDGVEFVAQCKKKFDVIITDSSDPVGKQQEVHIILIPSANGNSKDYSPCT